LTVLFLVAFALTQRGIMPRTAAIVLGFLAAFVLVYLLGFFNIQTQQGLDQFTKGMVKFVLHFLFLATGVAYLVQRGRSYSSRTAASRSRARCSIRSARSRSCSRTCCTRAGTTSRSCCARAFRPEARRAARISPSTTSSRRSSTRTRCSGSG